MTKLLDTYVSDSQPIHIRILDDMIKLVLGGVGTKEGVGITDYKMVVIDTDGSITKNDTLKSAFDGAARFPEHWSVHTHRLKDIVQSTAFAEAVAAQRPTSEICLKCTDLNICGGGMPLHRWRDDNEYSNPSIYCADQKLLIQKIRHTISSSILSGS